MLYYERGKRADYYSPECCATRRVPLYIHGINEAPIIGIGKHITDGLPESMQFHEMNDSEKMKLLDTLFLIHEVFGVDGFTSFEIGHEIEMNEKNVKDDWGVAYRLKSSRSSGPIGHPLRTPGTFITFQYLNHTRPPSVA